MNEYHKQINKFYYATVVREPEFSDEGGRLISVVVVKEQKGRADKKFVATRVPNGKGNEFWLVFRGYEGYYSFAWSPVERSMKQFLPRDVNSAVLDFITETYGGKYKNVEYNFKGVWTRFYNGFWGAMVKDPFPEYVSVGDTVELPVVGKTKKKLEKFRITEIEWRGINDDCECVLVYLDILKGNLKREVKIEVDGNIYTL